jgi:GT2 family glycosyltransferase
VNFLEAHPRVGIVGSRLEDPDGTPQHSRYRFPGVVSEFEDTIRLGIVSRLLKNRMAVVPIVDHPHSIDWVCGGSMMVRREVFQDVGLLDEGYFMYYEETDFCRAARKAGWESWYVPSSHVVHLVGQTSGVTARDRRPKRTPPYWFASRRRYFVKNHGRVYAALVDLASLFGFSLWRLRRAIQRKPDPDPPRCLYDRVFQSVFFQGFQA